MTDISIPHYVEQERRLAQALTTAMSPCGVVPRLSCHESAISLLDGFGMAWEKQGSAERRPYNSRDAYSRTFIRTTCQASRRAAIVWGQSGAVWKVQNSYTPQAAHDAAEMT